MFAIKVMNPHDMDYRMFSAKEYRVERRYFDNPDIANSIKPIEQLCETYLILDESSEDLIKRVVAGGSTIYVMNQDGKTIDTIR